MNDWTQLPLAQPSEDFLTMILWIIIGIFWMIAQVFQRIQQRKGGGKQVAPGQEVEESEPGDEEDAQPGTVPRNMQEGLRSFLEEITGATEEEEPVSWKRTLEEPEEPRKPEPPPPPPPPLIIAQEALPPLPTEEAGAYAEIQAIAEIEDMAEMEEMHFDPGKITTNIVGPTHLLVGLGALRMPMPIITIQTVDTAMNTRIKPPPLRGPGNLQRAILSRVVLGPPKALRDELQDLQDPCRS